MYDDRKQSGLGIAAMILSFTGCLLAIGIILAIIDLARGDQEHKHTCAKIALGIWGFWIIVGAAVFVFTFFMAPNMEGVDMTYTLNGEEVTAEEWNEYWGNDSSSSTDSTQGSLSNASGSFGSGASNSSSSGSEQSSLGDSSGSFGSNEQSSLGDSSGSFGSTGQDSITSSSGSFGDSGSSSEQSSLGDNSGSFGSSSSNSGQSSLGSNSGSFGSNSSNTGSNSNQGQTGTTSGSNYTLNGTKDSSTVEFWIDTYLGYNYGRDGVIESAANSSGASTAEVEMALNNYNVNWDGMALDYANQLLADDDGGYSVDSLTGMLEYHSFTQDNINYAMNNIQPNWNEEAAECLAGYLESDIDFDSRDSAINQMEFEGFTTEQAEYAATANGF